MRSAEIRTVVRCEHVMNGVTKTIFNISKIAKIATDFKSLFTLDLNQGAFTNETTSDLIVYVNHIYVPLFPAPSPGRFLCSRMPFRVYIHYPCSRAVFINREHGP